MTRVWIGVCKYSTIQVDNQTKKMVYDILCS